MVSAMEIELKLPCVTCGDVIDGVVGLGRYSRLPMSSVLHAAEIDDERDKNQTGMQDRLVDGIRGCPCGFCSMISPMHAEIYS